MNSSEARALCGLINLNKPTGMTSREAVDLIARPLKRFRVKVGHAGTLDPLASGVLVIAVGSATRLIEQVQGQRKTYETLIRLNATSDTLDADGKVQELTDLPIPSDAAIEKALRSQEGEILQLPPQFSALKVGGVRAYDLARAGQIVELQPRRITVDSIRLLSFDWPCLRLEITCGGGTYIRSMARDIGIALGTGGLVEVLTRTRIGSFRLQDAISTDPAALEPKHLPSILIDPARAVANLTAVELTDEQARAIQQGQAVCLKDAPAACVSHVGEVALLSPLGKLVALAEWSPQTQRLEPRRVFAIPDG